MDSIMNWLINAPADDYILTHEQIFMKMEVSHIKN